MKKKWILTLALLALLASNSNATVLIYQSFDDLVEKADGVFVGTVSSTEPYYNDVPKPSCQDDNPSMANVVDCNRGSAITIPYGFSNRSTQRVDFNIGYYLSSNATISTSDLRLTYNTGAWVTSGFNNFFYKTVVIPTSVTPGQYYLGVILDFQNLVAEEDELNNYLLVPTPVTIQ